MKSRKSFVSNSSSSSFIIGLGKVTDIGKFKEYCNESKFSKWDMEVYSVKEMIKLHESNEKYYGPITQKSDGSYCIAVESFMHNELKMDIDPEKDEYIVVVDCCPDEGDSTFMIGDWEGWDGEMDYDIDKTHFDNPERKLLDLGSLDYIEDYQCKFGAWRNG